MDQDVIRCAVNIAREKLGIAASGMDPAHWAVKRATRLLPVIKATKSVYCNREEEVQGEVQQLPPLPNALSGQ
ncbi:hypothetical protein PoB_004831700 [Plakobranchus ocellatus]|uniref:Uncharacterized protein n=1 Tax=Plakobranchus ocellatus TaxID=259542 RepID=A0AAV4BS50_9GAST|nr:hypothetical protein PoB_004831700 [Plakobranchus ocellatus]